MINIYIEISEEILKILNTSDLDDVKLINGFKKRQDLIDSLNEKELEEFKKVYNEEEIYKIEKLLDSDLDIPKGRYRLAHKMISKKLFRTTYIYFKTLNNEIKSKPLKKILNFIVKNLLKIVKDKD